MGHPLLTVADLDRTWRFYQEMLGIEMVTFAGKRRALTFDRQEINPRRVGMPPWGPSQFSACKSLAK